MAVGRSSKQLHGRLRTRNADITSMWLMPYNRWTTHWALLIVDFTTQVIVHIDTLKTSPKPQDVLYIQQMMEAARPTSTSDDRNKKWARWQLVVPDKTPLQDDSHFCGPRVCFYAEVAASGLDSGHFQSSPANT